MVEKHWLFDHPLKLHFTSFGFTHSLHNTGNTVNSAKLEAMDAHFNKILGPQVGNEVQFISANRFEGSKKGYTFQNGSKGVGYYFDQTQAKLSREVAQAAVSIGFHSMRSSCYNFLIRMIH